MKIGRLPPIALSLIAAASCALAGPKTNAQPAFKAFFPFCIDWHDSEKRSMEQQAKMLKELGYDGVGHIWLDKLPERLQSLDAEKLKLFQITISVNLAPGKPAYDARLKDVMPLVKGRGVQFLLLMNGMKPSDPQGDERAAKIVREIAALSPDAGTQFLLYPHSGDWLERIEDAVRLADKIDLPNVGVMFNLCHWLRVSKDRDYASRLKQALPRLWAVSINGADERDDQPGWGRYIQPLGRGSFDTFQLLRTLQDLGYSGPVGLQCYGITGDARLHLQESMKAWRAYNERLSGK